MPFADPAEKKAYMKRYRKHTIANGYGKWLYQRRALRRADADHFQRVLLEIESITNDESVLELVRQAFAESSARWAELGPSPAKGLKEQPKLADDGLAKRALES